MFRRSFCSIYLQGVLYVLSFGITWSSQEKVIPAVLESSVTLECGILVKDKLVWDHIMGNVPTILAIDGTLHGHANSSKYSLQKGGGLQTLLIHRLALSDDGQYRCYDLANTGIKEIFNVTILVQPWYFNSTGPSGVVEEDTLQLFTCVTDGGKPTPNIEWIVAGSMMNDTRYTGANTDYRYSNGTYRRTNNLLLRISREMYKASVICKAYISILFNSQQPTVLDVHLKPLPPQLLNFNGLFDDGKLQNIECHSSGSYPAGKLSWRMNGNTISRQMYQSFTPTKDVNGLYSVNSILIMRFTRAMEGQVLSCDVTNAVLANQNQQSRSVSVTLLANYKPVVMSSNGTRSVTEDDDVMITCTVDARPLPVEGELLWFHNGALITDRTTFNISQTTLSISKMVSKLQIFPVTNDSFGQYRCQASNHLGVTRGSVLTLEVLYRPICAFSGEERHAVAVGSSVALNCQVRANPPNVTMTWRYTTKGASPIKEKMIGLKTIDGSMYTSVNIMISLENQYGGIECLATNRLGTAKSPCLYLIVKPGPPEMPSACTAVVLGDTEIQASCKSGFDGGYKQYFILQHLDNGVYHPVQNKSQPVFQEGGLTPGTNYTYRICAASSAYVGIICALPVTGMTSSHEPTVKSQQIGNAQQTNTTPYIVGGVGGFLLLIVIIVLTVYCLRRKQQVGKPSADVRGNSGKYNTPCMPTITDCFTHAQFQSVVDSPKQEHLDNLQRQSADGGPSRTLSLNDWKEDNKGDGPCQFLGYF